MQHQQKANHPRFSGCGTALVTPFTKDLKVDFESFRRLVARQIASGIDFLLVLGSTAETATLTKDECLELVKIAIEESKGQVPLLVGAGTNALEATLERLELFSVFKEQLSGFLIVTPYYNKPTQEGLIAYYTRLAEFSPLPIMLYNVPGRTGINMQSSTTLELAKMPNIIAIKEASGNYAQCARILNEKSRGFELLAGDDNLTLALMATGASGVISVASNLVPKQMVCLVRSIQQNDLDGARVIYRKLEPLFTGCFLESNPIPIKWALSHAGFSGPWMRLPLVTASSHTQQALAAIMQNLDIV